MPEKFAMALRSLDHVLLAMPPNREAEARAFYRDLLGIPEVGKPANLAARGGCWFELGAVKIHLGVEKDFRPARKAHPAFLVDDVRALAAKAAAAGYRTAEDEPLASYDRVYVYDPFGNRIELMQRL
jgi:catechol 2,3-dioxygenase-like lactoylglutathione lyase family enzyme